jgi:transcriptional regulator with XRE-family HTH domain
MPMDRSAATRFRAHRRRGELLRSIGADLHQYRADLGLSMRALANGASVSVAHVWAIEHARTEPSLAVLAALGDAMGLELSVRFYPNGSPRLRDHIQAAIAEVILRELDSRWKPFVEVPVSRPSRGVIDLVLHDRARRVLVAVEIHSELRRLEQQLRWANAKAQSFPSADLWRFASADGPLLVSQLLVVRSSATMRRVIEEHRSVVAAGYPARTRDVYQALAGPSAPWPGPGVIWAAVQSGKARLLGRPPRGVHLGR